MSIPFLMPVTSPTPPYCSLHLTLWPPLSRSASLKPASPPPPLCFSFLSVCTSAVRKEATTIFHAIRKQPSSGCYDTPQAIVIESHYSRDLTFNPSYVIGPLSAVQAGLTPQTAAHFATMLRHYVLTPQANDERTALAASSDDEAAPSGAT